MKLAELASWESRVMHKVQGLTGTMEDKAQALLNSPLANQYQDIHVAYTSLAQHSPEALKKSCFHSVVLDGRTIYLLWNFNP